MDSLLADMVSDFSAISLEEMAAVRLMNRTDTKYVTTREKLTELLRLLKDDYFCQEIDGLRVMTYKTQYFDTPDSQMYRVHQTGHTNRCKVRIRQYESGANFLEVKFKNNHGRTQKKRIEVPCLERIDSTSYNFLTRHIPYDPQSLLPKVQNRFERITLVSKEMSERVTIDTNLSFHNQETGMDYALPEVVIIELKRDGRCRSLLCDRERELRIHESGFSKYCIGSALTNPALRQNQVKSRIRSIQKLQRT